MTTSNQDNKPTLTYAQLIDCIRMTVEQNGLARVLHAVANVAYEKAREPVPGANTWRAAAEIVDKASTTPAVVRVTPFDRN